VCTELSKTTRMSKANSDPR